MPVWLKIGNIRIQSKDTDLIYQELQGNNPYQLEHGRLWIDRLRGRHKLLKISFIRHKGGKKYFREKKPDDDEEDKKDHDEVCNHSKYIIVDDVCSYTGSQNLYVSNLAEWGVIVDDAKLTAKMLEDYWNPMWTASYDETDSDMNKVIDNVKNNFEDFGDATISTDEKAEDFLEAIMRDDAPRL